MTRFVLDSSYSLSWLLPDERTEESQRVLRGMASGDFAAVTSSLWYFEVTNALIVCERRGRLTHAQSERLIQTLQSLPIGITDSPLEHIFSKVAARARTSKLTVYDAAYLQIALETGFPLASLDKALNKAAREVGIELMS